MPTPMGHALTGLAVWTLCARRGRIAVGMAREEKTGLLLCLAASLAPDLDFILISQSGITVSERFHHGPSHSFAAAFIVSFAVAAFLYVKSSALWRSYGLMVFFSWSGHVFFDFVGCDGYAENGLGVPLFWPLSDTDYMLNILLPVDIHDPFAFSSLVALAVEAVLFGGVYLTARQVQKWRSQRQNGVDSC